MNLELLRTDDAYGILRVTDDDGELLQEVDISEDLIEVWVDHHDELVEMFLKLLAIDDPFVESLDGSG